MAQKDSRPIILLADRNHHTLEEPMFFWSHKEACSWLDRRYTFVYKMVLNGEAIEIGHAWNTISPKAQLSGRSSDYHHKESGRAVKDTDGWRSSRQVCTSKGGKITGSSLPMSVECREAARKLHARPCEYNGVIYESQNECAVKNNMTKWKVSDLVKKGIIKRL